MPKITIEGVEYPIIFRMKAVSIYQDLTGESLLSNSDEFTKVFGGEINGQKVSIDSKKFMALVTAALMNGNPKMTMQEADEIVGMVDFFDTKIYSDLTDLFKRDTEKNLGAPVETTGA